MQLAEGSDAPPVDTRVLHSLLASYRDDTAAARGPARTATDPADEAAVDAAAAEACGDVWNAVVDEGAVRVVCGGYCGSFV